MAIEDKSSRRAKLAISLRCKAQKLSTLLAESLSESEKAAQERSHLATRTDHAFLGCNPCPPVDRVPPAQTVANIAAIPRPGTEDG